MSDPRAKPGPSGGGASQLPPTRSATGSADRPRPFRIPLAFMFLAFLVASIIIPSPTTPQLLSDYFGPPGTALFLTAHPDDEAMFFAPSIFGLQRAGWDVSGLCLSTGNAEGLGEVRRHELTASYAALGVQPEKVMVIDHPVLQDDINTRWSGNIVGAIVDSYLAERDVNMIITFDRQGISNHPNHASLSAYRSNSTAVYHLVSPSIPAKYTGPLARLIPAQLASQMANIAQSLYLPWRSDGITIEADLAAWRRGVWAMLQHRTQMVWFRWLYIATSRLMWVNQLVRVDS